MSPLQGSKVPGTQHESTNVGALPVPSHPPWYDHSAQGSSTLKNPLMTPFFYSAKNFSVKQMRPSRLIYFGNWVFLFVLGFLKVG